MTTTSASLGVGVYNALTARIAERAGFDILWVSARDVCLRFGQPDPAAVTPTQIAAVAAEIRVACDLRLYVDAGDGGGSDESAAHVVRLLERAGAHAVCLHDGAPGPARLLPRDDAARRLAAACAARETMRVIAGTDALVAGGAAGETVARLRAYESAGADALFVRIDRDSRDLLAPVLAEVRGRLPVVLAPEALPEVSVEDLAALGVTDVIFRDVVTRTVSASVPRILAAVRSSGRLATVVDDIAPVQAVFDLVAPR